MYYAPHELYRKEKVVERDSLNRVVNTTETDVLVCACRCDDNTTQKFEDENGRVYTPKYKIVCDRANVSVGDEIQCLDKATGTVRGKGRVYNISKCNYLNYMVLYV